MALSHQAGNQRDANEPDIIAGLERLGCTVYKLDTPCDLVVGWRGRTFLLEVKSSRKAKLTKPQREFFNTWRGHATVVVDLDEAVAAVTSGGPTW